MLYKQLSAARDDDELRELRDDLLDRFGPLPVEAQNLVEVIRLKIRCRRLGVGVDVTAASCGCASARARASTRRGSCA